MRQISPVKPAASECRSARRPTATRSLWQAAVVEHSDDLEFEEPVRWVINIWASFGDMTEGFEEGFRTSIVQAAVGPVAVTASSDGIRAAFELDGTRRDEVEASAHAIGTDALRAGAASVRNPTPGPHGWSFSVGVELARR
jgi:hypothetical protein